MLHGPRAAAQINIFARKLHVHASRCSRARRATACLKLRPRAASAVAPAGSHVAFGAIYSAGMALQARQEEQILQYIEESNSSGRLASGWDQLKEFLLAEGLAYYQQVPPNQMGIDIRNRSGSLVNPARAHNLGAKICAQGFVLAKTAAATAFEAPQGAQLEETAMANDRLSRLSGGRCPPLDSLRYTSVGGSHTNVFLRCVLAKAPTTVKALADSRDNIDSEKLCALHPQLATAVKKGLTWLIIKHAVAKVKGLKNFVQRALNADVREAVHETEIIRSGCSLSPL